MKDHWLHCTAVHQVQLRAHRRALHTAQYNHWLQCKLYCVSSSQWRVESHGLPKSPWYSQGLLGTPWDDVGSHGPRKLPSAVILACAHPRSVRTGHVQDTRVSGVPGVRHRQPDQAWLAQGTPSPWQSSGKGKGGEEEDRRLCLLWRRWQGGPAHHHFGTRTPCWQTHIDSYGNDVHGPRQGVILPTHLTTAGSEGAGSVRSSSRVGGVQPKSRRRRRREGKEAGSSKVSVLWGSHGLLQLPRSVCVPI